VNVADFLTRAINLAGGTCQREGDLLRVLEVPANWAGGRVPARYDALYLDHATAPRSARPQEILDDEHDLVQRAIRWIRESRYSRQDDHRMAARLTAAIDQPDLAKVSLWLVTAASRMPLSFLDHRLRCGDSLLGIPAEEVVRPWVADTNGKGSRPKDPVALLISPKHGQGTFDYLAPSGRALCQSFTRAFACLRQLVESVQADPSNFEGHQASIRSRR